MKSINTYIFEKLKITKDIQVPKEYALKEIIDDPKKVKTDLLEEDIPLELNDHKFPDNMKKRFLKNGDGKGDNLWWKFWKILAYNGPMKKETLNLSLGLVPTSYSSIYADLSRQNIIIPDRKRKVLVAKPVSEWKL